MVHNILSYVIALYVTVDWSSFHLEIKKKKKLLVFIFITAKFVISLYSFLYNSFQMKRTFNGTLWLPQKRYLFNKTDLQMFSTKNFSFISLINFPFSGFVPLSYRYYVMIWLFTDFLVLVFSIHCLLRFLLASAL